MRYLIAIKQVGEGCDYTIGCGMTYRFEDHDGTLEEALAHFTTIVCYPDGEGGRLSIDGDRALEEVWVVPADDAVLMDLNEIRAQDQRRRDAQCQSVDRQAAEAEFERLRKLLGR